MALVYQEARRAANNIRRDHWNSRRFPVDVEAIARDMGIDVQYTFLREGVSGMVQARPPENPIIYVDRTEVPTRQRFTIAHELGHFVERSNQGRDTFAFIDERGAKYDLHEFYADEFAGALLMPTPEIRALQGRGARVVEMAAHFGVSAAAMNHRLSRLDRADGIVE